MNVPLRNVKIEHLNSRRANDTRIGGTRYVIEGWHIGNAFDRGEHVSVDVEYGDLSRMVPAEVCVVRHSLEKFDGIPDVSADGEMTKESVVLQTVGYTDGVGLLEDAIGSDVRGAEP